MELRTEVAVVGGGSTGSSIIYHVAKAGVSDCTLLDKESQIAAGQTSLSTALVRTHYSVEIVARMALRCYSYFENFEKNLPGRTAGFVKTGLVIGAGTDAKGALDDNMKMLRKLGITTKLVDRDEALRIEPYLGASGFTNIVFEPEAGYAEPSTTASSFASAGRELGAKFMMERKVTKIERSAGGYRLETPAGSLWARKVVLATGPWSRPIFASLGIDLPVKAVRHPVAIYHRPEEYEGTHPFILDLLRSAYYKPEGRYLLIAGSLELELDTHGAEVDPDGYDRGVTTEEVTKMTGKVMDAIPLMASKGEYERGFAGVYDVTPDQQPIIDELSDYGYENLFCLVGLSGHGFKLCPEYGRIMAAMVTDGKFRDYDTSVFRLSRFKEGKLLKSSYRVGTVG
jgi:glycine/D-amino acid oxidase-like deaminating enzyme